MQNLLHWVDSLQKLHVNVKKKKVTWDSRQNFAHHHVLRKKLSRSPTDSLLTYHSTEEQKVGPRSLTVVGQ